MNASPKFIRARRVRRSAFSLVEVTLALGILGVALIPLLGLVPVGMQVFREAIDTTVQTQIVQSISSMAEQTNFGELDQGDEPVGRKLGTRVSSAASRAVSSPVTYYFNDQGNIVAKDKAVYTALVSYWVPSGSGTDAVSSGSLATLWIDIYNNKGVYEGGKPIGKAQTVSLLIADFGKRI